MDNGKTYWGQEVNLGIAEGGVGIVKDKNFDKIASDATKTAVENAEKDILDGKIKVDSTLGGGDGSSKVDELKKAVQP